MLDLIRRVFQKFLEHELFDLGILGLLFFLGAVLLLSVYRRESRSRWEDSAMTVVAVLAVVFSVGSAYFKSRFPDRRLVLVQPRETVNLLPELTAELVDITTLQRHPHESNKSLVDRQHVFDEVIKRADLPNISAELMAQMTNEEWDTYLTDLERKGKSALVNTALNIPFAMLKVLSRRVELEDYRSRYFFKGEHLPVAAEHGRSLRVTHVFLVLDKATAEQDTIVVESSGDEGGSDPIAGAEQPEGVSQVASEGGFH